MISPQELGRVSAALLGLTAPYTYQQALAATELGEKRLCETAQRLLLRGAFRPREEDLWRGWLGLSGPVRVSPTAGLLADESPLVASGPSPALQREQDEELEEAVSRPQRAPRRPYHTRGQSSSGSSRLRKTAPMGSFSCSTSTGVSWSLLSCHWGGSARPTPISCPNTSSR